MRLPVDNVIKATHTLTGFMECWESSLTSGIFNLETHPQCVRDRDLLFQTRGLLSGETLPADRYQTRGGQIRGEMAADDVSQLELTWPEVSKGSQRSARCHDRKQIHSVVLSGNFHSRLVSHSGVCWLAVRCVCVSGSFVKRHVVLCERCECCLCWDMPDSLWPLYEL